MIHATVLIFETLEASLEEEVPDIIEALKKMGRDGLFQEEVEIANIEYIQNSLGDCDFILQLNSKSFENIMAAVNLIRDIPQVKFTKTHVGEIIYKTED